MLTFKQNGFNMKTKKKSEVALKVDPEAAAANILLIAHEIENFWPLFDEASMLISTINRGSPVHEPISLTADDIEKIYERLYELAGWITSHGGRSCTSNEELNALAGFMDYKPNRPAALARTPRRR